jgi:hypothetical protein
MILFVLVNGELQLNAPEIILIKEFNNILVHSERCDSDPNGQKKHFAYMKFNYIYQVADYNAYPSTHGHSEKEAHEYAISVSGLPKDWKPDDLTKMAISRYKQLRPSPARELNSELLATIHTCSKLVGKINKFLEKLLEKPDFKDEDIAKITDQHFRVMDIAKKIPEQLKALDEQKHAIDREDGGAEKARGGADIQESQNANNEIENREVPDNEDE